MAALPPPPLPTLASSTVITPDNHGAYVTITASLMLVSMLLLTALRLYIRYPFTQLFGLDDAAVVLSTIFAIAQTATILKAVRYGLGRHVEDLSDDDREAAQKLTYTGNVLFVASLSLSRAATSLLVARLTRPRNQVVASHVTSAIIMGWGVAFLLGVSINCRPSRPWDMQIGRCSNWQAIWTGFGLTGLLFEIVLVLLPVYLLWGLQMPLSSKMTVATGFCFRLPIIPIEAFRLLALSRTLSSTDPTSAAVPFSALSSVEMHYSLVAATIPCLRPFLKAANTGLLRIDATQVDHSGSYLSRSGGGSYAMKSMGSAAERKIVGGKSVGNLNMMLAGAGGGGSVKQMMSAALTATATGPLKSSSSNPDSSTVTTEESTGDGIARSAAGQGLYFPTGGTQQAQASDDTSITSDGSEKLIIRKATDRDVRYSPAVGYPPPGPRENKDDQGGKRYNSIQESELS